MPYKSLFLRAWAHMRSSRTIWALALISVGASVVASLINDRIMLLFFLSIQAYVEIICSAGLIWTVFMLEKQKTPILAEVPRAVHPFFWRLIGIGILVGAIAALVAFPICFCSTMGVPDRNSGIFYNFLFFGVVFGFFGVFPACFLLSQGTSVVQSIVSGFRMIGKNFGSYLLLSLLFFVVEAAAVLICWGIATLVYGNLAPAGTPFYIEHLLQASTPVYQILNYFFTLILRPLTSTVFTLAFLEYLKPAAWQELRAINDK